MLVTNFQMGDALESVNDSSVVGFLRAVGKDMQPVVGANQRVLMAKGRLGCVGKDHEVLFQSGAIVSDDSSELLGHNRQVRQNPFQR